MSESRVVQIKGKPYVVIGDKAVPVDYFDENGKPVTNAMYSTEKNHPDGRRDVTVHVECFQIAAQSTGCESQVESEK